jgi:hypothetical protein
MPASSKVTPSHSKAADKIASGGNTPAMTRDEKNKGGKIGHSASGPGAITTWPRSSAEPVIRASRFLTEAEFLQELDRLGVPQARGTLKNWRYLGKGGPRFYRIGSRVVYAPEDIEEWVRNCRFGPGHKRDPRPATMAPPAEAATAREGGSA